MNQLNDYDEAREILLAHIIKENISTGKNEFFCSICKNFTGRNRSGFAIHIGMKHKFEILNIIPSSDSDDDVFEKNLPVDNCDVNGNI
jgi:hypothetical protein